MPTQSDFDKPAVLLSSLGTHWQDFYAGSAVVSSILFAAAQSEAQTYLDFVDSVLCLSHQTVPLYRRQEWSLLTIRQSDQNNRVLRYGEGRVYGPQPGTGKVYRYGIATSGFPPRYAAGPDLVEAPILTNLIFDPSVVLVASVDYEFDSKQGQIAFRMDPFQDSRIPTRNVYDQNGQIIDREAALWVYSGKFDRNYIASQFGYAFQLEMPTSQPYKETVSSLYQAANRGGTGNIVASLISAATGIPIAKSDGETVQYLLKDTRQSIIATDRYVYSGHLDAIPVVAEGDVLFAGQALFDSLEFHEFGREETPAWITEFNAAEGWLPGDYKAGLSFLSTEVPLIIEGTVGGKTKISFQIEGRAETKDKFWDELHTRGLEQGMTLAEFLDQRPKPLASQPTAATLPTTINPLEFLISHILRYNAFAVRIKTHHIASPSQLLNGESLRSVVPPWTAMIVYTETMYQEEIADSLVTMELELTEAMEVVSESIDETDVDMTLTLSYTEPLC